MLLGYLSLVFIGPFIAGVTQQISLFVGWLIQRNLLLLTNIFIEPLKVLFLNNTLNHGILTPLGIEQTEAAGTSLLFLIETNPGPRLGCSAGFHSVQPERTEGQRQWGLYDPSDRRDP